MEKIIIRVYDEIPMTEAILMVHNVIHRGRISNNGKSYCYMTAFNDGDITVDSTNNSGNSDTFKVYKRRHLHENS